MLGLAAIILVLGTTYWLIREQDARPLGLKSGAIVAGERAEVDVPPIVGQRGTTAGAEEKTTVT
jgi:hypothetical protein